METPAVNRAGHRTVIEVYQPATMIEVTPVANVPHPLGGVSVVVYSHEDVSVTPKSVMDVFARAYGDTKVKKIYSLHFNLSFACGMWSNDAECEYEDCSDCVTEGEDNWRETRAHMMLDKADVAIVFNVGADALPVAMELEKRSIPYVMLVL